MYEDRFTDARCHEFTSGGADRLCRLHYWCEFKVDHLGMHFAAHYFNEGSSTPTPSPSPQRWGTEEQLSEEMRMRSKPYPAAAL